ncbi:MAG: type IV toxin-antitoxin system AbiEi family antitoxin domain-containing protein [Acidimicrobiales bacterium]
MSDLDRRLAAVAVDQHSLLTWADVARAGGTKAQASRRVDAGRWDRVSPGVYRIGGAPWTYDARVLADVMAAGDGAVASHRCAARLLGLGFASAPTELSIPRGRHHRPAGALVHQSTDLDRATAQLVRGVPTTDPARTLLDLGRYIGPVPLRRAIEQARRLGLTDWSDLVSCLARHARQGRHGIRRLRQVVSAGMVIEEVTDTDSELIAVTLIREHGLPDPILHHRVWDDDGDLLAETDLAWPDRRAVIEIDGPVHLDPEVRRHDDARDHELRRRGWMVRRVWRDVPLRQPQVFLRLTRDLLRDADHRS